MFWFKNRMPFGDLVDSEFQYIICFGSSMEADSNAYFDGNFNTSYVLVQGR